MVTRSPNQFILYRWRYVAAYILFGVSLTALLFVAGFYLPGGLADNEIRSAVASESLDPSKLLSLHPSDLVYLPYKLLQAASIGLFGVSAISIKLPSLVLGIASALGLLYLLSLWFRRNVAIVTATIAVTTTQFLFAAQSGQAGIMYIFVTTFILIAASLIARRNASASMWVIAGFALAAIGLYLPLNLYILIALLLTAIIHPHARHLIRYKASKLTIAIGILLFAILILPLAVGIANHISLLWTLLGMPRSLSVIGPNATELLRQYGQVHTPISEAVLVPVYGLGVLLLVALGLYRLFSTKYTTKSYVLSFWLVLLVPFIILNPELIAISFVPVVLLIALAIEYLIWSWYRLFPRNPYARVFGLLPLSILIGGLIISSVDRYAYGFHYDKAVNDAFSFDLAIVSKKIHSLDENQKVTLVVANDNKAFYSSYAKQTPSRSIEVVSRPQEPQPGKITIVERDLAGEIRSFPSEILVSSASEEGDRFYLYTSERQ